VAEGVTTHAVQFRKRRKEENKAGERLLERPGVSLEAPPLDRKKKKKKGEGGGGGHMSSAKARKTHAADFRWRCGRRIGGFAV